MSTQEMISKNNVHELSVSVWIIPLILIAAALEIGLRSTLADVWMGIFPFFAEPVGYDASALFAPELRAQWVGAWGLLGLFFVLALFNTFLGEEFIFRGVLLPKMEGFFSKWDWLANAVLLGAAHWGKPWHIPSGIVSGILYTYPSRRFCSAWFGLIVHGADGLFFLFLILGLILGLA